MAKQTTPTQGKSATATVSPSAQGKTETPPAVSVNVSPVPATTIPHGSGIQGDPANPAERKPLTSRERFLAAIQETPVSTSGRSKDNPVTKKLEENFDIIRDCKKGINGMPKMTTKQICLYLGKINVIVSTATLSNFMAEKGLTKDRGEGVTVPTE